MVTKKKKTRTRTKASTRTRASKAAVSRLKPADIERFKDLLLQKRREIIGDVDAMTTETLKKERSDLSKVPFHMADAGSDNFEMENTLGLMDEEMRLLVRIDAALERIANGTYGICTGSGKPIPKARLEAIPWARYCLEYAEMLEKGLIEPGEQELDEDQDEEDKVEEVMEQLDEHIAMMGDDTGDDKDEEDHADKQ
jgi:RNA polymerase-binding protein DksA